jgi:pimeloyl-ACP methyl ester carboxylesterase
MSVDVFTRRRYIQGLAGALGAAMMSNKLRAANQNVAYGEATIPSGIRSRFVSNINGLTVHMLEAGFDNNDRPCILLLHGFPELAYSWRKIMLPLASAGYHVIAPDQRGYGRTTGWDGSYDGDLGSFSMLNMVRDALGLVSALGYRSVAAVVGHDAGSPVAGWCSLVRPDVFRSVAMMSAPFAGPPALPFSTANQQPAKAAEAAPEASTSSWLRCSALQVLSALHHS